MSAKSTGTPPPAKPEPRLTQMAEALDTVERSLRPLTPEERRRVLASICCLHDIEVKRSDWS